MLPAAAATIPGIALTPGITFVRRLVALLLTLDLLAIFGFVRPLRLASHYPGETLSLFDIIGHSPGTSIRYTLLIVTMLAVFVTAYLLAKEMHGRHMTLLVFGGAALLALTFLLMYPATNSDLFHYAMEGRILWVHHANPFTIAPNAYPGDHFAVDINGYWQVVWYDLASPYGPAWAVLTGLPILFGHGDPFWTFIGFKLLAIGFYCLAAAVIFHAVRFLRPGLEWSAVVLFAWNPLVLLYVGGNGANDVIMMGLALLALYLGMRARWRAAFPVLALATLVKFVCALLIPVFILYAVLTTPREKWRSLAESLGVSALIGLLLYAPFWRGQVTFTTLRYQASQFTDSPPALLLQMLQKIASPGISDVITKSVALMLFAMAYMLIARWMWLRRDRRSPDDLSAAAFAVMFAYLMLSVFWFQPWYLLWLISLGAVTIGVRARLTLLFSLCGLLTHTATSIAAIEGWYYNNPPLEVAIVVGTVFVFPALYVATAIFWRSPPGRRMRLGLSRWRLSRRRSLASGSEGVSARGA